MKKSVLKNEANLLLEKHLDELGLKFEREFRFHPERKWRFDYLITSRLTQMCLQPCYALEIEGGIWIGGRHTSGAGYSKDLEKYREAAIRGYCVLRFSVQEVLEGTAREFLQKHVSGVTA